MQGVEVDGDFFSESHLEGEIAVVENIIQDVSDNAGDPSQTSS